MAKEMELILDRASVRTALDDLNGIRRRPVQFRHEPGIEAAELKFTRDGFTVLVDTADPLAEHSVVHELCHAIMFEEGYPLAVYPALDGFPVHVADQMSSFLTNQFHHCDVFRRMQHYGLDMAPYYERWDTIAAGDFANYTQDKPDNALRHLHVWLVYPWFFMGRVGEKYLVRYAEYDPVVYDLAHRTFERNGGLEGFSTAERGRNTYETMRKVILDFCTEPAYQNDDGVVLTLHIRLMTLDDYLAGRPTGQWGSTGSVPTQP